MTKGIQMITLQVYSRRDATSEDFLTLRKEKISAIEFSRRSRQMEFRSEYARDLLKFIATYDSTFYCPEKCDVYEPLREVFDPCDQSEPIQWLSQAGGRVLVKKTKPFRYEGFVENMRNVQIWEDGSPTPRPLPTERVFLTEWCLWLGLKLLTLKSLDQLIQFFIDLYLVSDGDYGSLTMEEDHKNKNYLITPMGKWASHKFVGDKLEYCLPGVYFGNIFGKLYVDWFGTDRFVSLPCHTLSELSDGSYYVQSSADLFYYRNPEGARLDRQIIEYLGTEAFFDIRDPARVYDVPEYVKLNRREL